MDSHGHPLKRLEKGLCLRACGSARIRTPSKLHKMDTHRFWLQPGKRWHEAWQTHDKMGRQSSHFCVTLPRGSIECSGSDEKSRVPPQHLWTSFNLHPKRLKYHKVSPLGLNDPLSCTKAATTGTRTIRPQRQTKGTGI